MVATRDVVVVLPCVPAMATPYFMRINSASISARGITGMCWARAVNTSTLSGLTAEEITTTSASCTCVAACPWDTVAPCCCSRLVTSESARSEPLTVYPSVSRTSAMPLIPMPPIPTTWMRWVLRIIPTPRPVQQLQAGCDDSISGLGPAESTAVRRLLLQQLGLTQQWLQHLIEPYAGELSIEDDLRRPLPLHGHGVVTLMIIGSIRVRHQNRRPATGGELRQCTGARPTQDQVGPAIAVGHIVQKRLHLRLQTRLGVGLGHLSTIGISSLVHQAKMPLMRCEHGRCLHHRLIDAMRPLTAAEHQEMQALVSTRRRCGTDLANLLTHRCAAILH